MADEIGRREHAMQRLSQGISHLSEQRRLVSGAIARHLDVAKDGPGTVEEQPAPATKGT